MFLYLQSKGIIVRNRNTTKGCEGCLRITVGTATENQALIEALKIILFEHETFIINFH